MKKLRLEPDSLAVESFATRAADGSAGAWARPTVRTVCDSTLLASNPTCCPCTPAF